MAVTHVAILSPASLPREAWKALLAGQPGIQVAGEAADAEGLAALALPEQGGCILVDVDGAGSVQAVRTVGRLARGWPILVLVDGYEVAQAIALLRAGALGVVSRASTIAELVGGLIAAARGEIVLPGSLAPEALAQLIDNRTVTGGSPTSLSPREAEVLQLLAEGRTNKLIAQALLISVRTVEAHLRSIYDKLGVSSRTEAVLWAVRHRSAGRG